MWAWHGVAIANFSRVTLVRLLKSGYMLKSGYWETPVIPSPGSKAGTNLRAKSGGRLPPPPPVVWLFLAWPCVHGDFVSGHHNSCSATYMHYKFLIVLFNLFCIQCLSHLVSLYVELLTYLADLEFVWWTHMIWGTKLQSSKLCLVLSWPFDLAGEEILV